MVVANMHLDIVMAVFFLICINPKFFKKDATQGFLYAISVLTKLFPLIFLPAFLLNSFKNNKLQGVFSFFIYFLGTIALVYSLYIQDSGGNLFSSTNTYLKNWYFFGYINRFSMDILQYAGDQDAFFHAKIISLILGSGIGSYLTWKLLKNRISMRLYFLCLTIAALALSPTIHPWYLILMLALSIPFWKVLYTPWIWAWLAIFSKFFYVNYEDPLALRVAIYFVISLMIYFDIRNIKIEKLSI
jgi:hypothetical protein